MDIWKFTFKRYHTNSASTLSVQSVGVFMADFDCFDFVVRSFAALDLTGVFRRFFGVDVAFATFDGDLGRE